MSLKRRAGLVAVAIGLWVITACGANAQSGPPTSAPPPPTTASESAANGVDGTVTVADFSPTCQHVICWLPVQFGPQLVQGESVSKVETWPMDKQRVHIICATKGERFRDQNGSWVDDWFQITVPSNEVSPAVLHDPRLLRIQKDFAGFVGAPWVEPDGPVNSCKPRGTA